MASPHVARLASIWRPALLGLVVIGCFWVILTPSDQYESNAAFGVLGVVTGALVRLTAPE